MFWKNRDFTEAYSDYYPLVFGAVYSKVGNADDAQDMCQEIFIRFYEKLETIEEPRKWLFGAIRLEVMAHYRKKKDDSVDIEELFQDIALSFVNGFRDIRIIIQEAIENMENYRDAIERILFDLIAINNFTYEEAGKQLGLTVRQVRYKYGQIVERLLDYLGKQGIKSLEDLL